MTLSGGKADCHPSGITWPVPCLSFTYSASIIFTIIPPVFTSAVGFEKQFPAGRINMILSASGFSRIPIK
jgi:hypothetical protein